MTSSIKVLGLGSLLILSACGPAKDMPDGMGSELFSLDSGTTKFSSLPLEGSVEEGQKFWSGDHWPLRKGIINRRWRSPFQDAFDTHSPTKAELSYMSEEDIAQLAPSEKYDLLMGNYDYVLKKEVSAKANQGALNWEGIGNGWAVASANHEEPVAKVLQNPDGINIPFGSSDIKALLSYYYAYYHSTTIPQLGIRCEEGLGDAPDIGCEDDLSASAFHIALTNQIGVNKRALIADVDPYKDVWNHPVHSFKSEVSSEEAPAEDAPTNAVKTMVMKTRMSYTDKTNHNSWDPLKDTWNQSTVKRVYTYNLYLDAEGSIVGGKWRSSDRPDFMWGMERAQEFTGYYSQLSKLIND